MSIFAKVCLRCNTCGKAFLTDLSRWDGRFCSDECNKEYRLRRAVVICGIDVPNLQLPFVRLEERTHEDT